MWPFKKKCHHRVPSHILSLWMVHAECVFVAGIHPSWTWMSGSFDSSPYDGMHHCICALTWLWFILLSERVFREWSQNTYILTLKSREKIPSTGISDEGWTCSTALRRTEAHHTTDWAIPAPILLTAGSSLRAVLKLVQMVSVSVHCTVTMEDLESRKTHIIVIYVYCCRDCLHQIDWLDRSRFFQKTTDSSQRSSAHL